MSLAQRSGLRSGPGRGGTAEPTEELALYAHVSIYGHNPAIWITLAADPLVGRAEVNNISVPDSAHICRPQDQATLIGQCRHASRWPYLAPRGLLTRPPVTGNHGRQDHAGQGLNAGSRPSQPRPAPGPAGRMRRLAMTHLNVNEARCEALFASALQPSDAPAASAVAEAIRVAVRQFGIRGCASLMAQEFGDHPEAAAERMRWVRQLLAASSHRPGRAPAGWHLALSDRPASRPRLRGLGASAEASMGGRGQHGRLMGWLGDPDQVPDRAEPAENLRQLAGVDDAEPLRGPGQGDVQVMKASTSRPTTASRPGRPISRGRAAKKSPPPSCRTVAAQLEVAKRVVRHS
jgi:hypothetical protein